MNDVQAGIVAVNRQAQVAEREARELKTQALRKKAYLQLKWDLDCNRKHLGKGNIVNILINDQNQRVVDVKKENINSMLRVSGFSIEDVMGITINEYRPNQVEGYSKVKQGIADVAATQSNANEMYSQSGKENFETSGNTLTFNRFV